MAGVFIRCMISFFIIVLGTPPLVRWLQKEQFGQKIREVGPRTHLKKEGVPTMGGLLFFSALLISVFFYFQNDPINIWTLFMVAGFSAVGFADDYLKIKRGRSLGLKARQKIFLMVLISSLVGLYVYLYYPQAATLVLPFVETEWRLGIYIIPFIVLVYLATTNAVNLTDGLDGLAAGVMAIALLSFVLLFALNGDMQAAMMSAAGFGLCLGFLWFNCHPASIIMGDTGSLGLGALLASLAVLRGMSIFIILAGGVFVLVTLSVVIQVTYFRLTGGKRIFRMSPLHHHFELAGWSEPQIVIRFLILGSIFAFLSLWGGIYGA